MVMEDFGNRQHEEGIRKRKCVSGLALPNALIIAFRFGSLG